LGSVKRERADKRVVDLGLAESRTRAQALILAGQVVIGDHVVDKPGAMVPVDAEVRLKGEPMPYVSRGGLKLQHALDHFAVEVTGIDALDVGASTGGFTDCLLSRGAARVCAVDVGTNQLAWKLRNDPRVISMEQLNARHLEVAALPFRPSLAVCDVSFISLTLILPKLAESGAGQLICLIKPQFEVGRERVEKGGVVRSDEARRSAIEKCCDAAKTLGYDVVGVIESPIKGPAGNVEYLMYARKP
jgi:23S rRNA (cytidine1920-2'-O)/16S rRNA (cytidine1409-2'-O)-methyltransferase